MNSKQGTQGSNLPKFVNYDMTKPEEALMRKYEWSPEKVVNWLCKLVDDTYKVSFKWDTYNDCAQASLTGTDGGVNEGLCLTQRGGDASKALMRVMYVHFVIFDGTWPKPDAAHPKYQDTW